MLSNAKISLNQVFIRIVLLGALAIIIIGLAMSYREKERVALVTIETLLTKSAALTSNYYSSLKAKLILGDQRELHLLLQHLKQEERLKSIAVVSSVDMQRSALETCVTDQRESYFLRTPTCYQLSGSSLFIYHELRSAGFGLGYLAKEIALPVTNTLTSAIRHTGPALLVFILVMGSVLAYIKRNLISPLHRMNFALKDAKTLPRKTLSFGIIELQNIFNSLQTALISIAEYEYKTHLGQVATRAAHDIRSPLSSMKSALMMLRGQFAANRDAADALNLLQLSSKRLDDIANGLLAKYRGEESASQVFSIHEVLDELIGELRASPIGNEVEFKKQYHDHALYVSGDNTGVSRALGNIIKNALEAMQGNSVEKTKQLIVCTALSPSPQPSPHKGEGKVVIRITDTGPGIPANKIPLILQGGHTEGKADGHGIGTKVVSEVVSAHHGHLDIESQVGVGTTFIITLPATLHHENMTVTIPYSAGGKIYVIDDEPSLREQWRLTLKAQGVVAKVFSCWEEFDSVRGEPVEPQQPTTFIIDYHFDNSLVDGLEIIRRLKSREYTQFILATAEYWKPDIKAAAKSLGATLCPKPLPKVVLEICHPEAQPKDLDSLVVMLPQNDNTSRTVLLIDDDDAIRLTWDVIKKQLGVNTLHSFPSLEAVIQAKVNLGDCDLCIIDKNIPGSDYDGARMLDYLKQNGAKKVILATGEQERDIRKDPQFDTLDGITAEKIPTSLERYW